MIALNKVISTATTKPKKNAQLHYDNHTCAKYDANGNGDIACYCKHKCKKGNTCAAYAKQPASGKITPFAEYGVKCVMDVVTTDANAQDCTNVIIELVDQFAVQNLNWAPGIVSSEIKKHCDSVSNRNWISENSTEAMNIARCA